MAHAVWSWTGDDLDAAVSDAGIDVCWPGDSPRGQHVLLAKGDVEKLPEAKRKELQDMAREHTVKFLKENGESSHPFESKLSSVMEHAVR